MHLGMLLSSTSFDISVIYFEVNNQVVELNSHLSSDLTSSPSDPRFLDLHSNSLGN